MSNKSEHLYKFRDFYLNVSERRLLHGGEPVSLTPKAFDVLTILVERSGRLVEKEDLLRLIWEDAFIEEAGIARVIHTLRKSLGESGENKFIETIAKRGYRFVAEVVEINHSDAATSGAAALFSPQKTSREIAELNGAEKLNDSGNASSAAENSAENAEAVSAGAGGGFQKKRLINLIALALLVLTLFAASAFLAGNFGLPGKGEEKSIAVLPLKPISYENRDPICELGVAESLILKLSSVKKLTVRPLSATRKYLELDQNAVEAGREQLVDYVLSSNYQIAGGKIRVTSQLINVRTGAVEKNLISEKNLTHIFSTQDAIANEIGDVLLAKFNYEKNNLTTSRGTTSEEAYRLYLQGMYVIDQVDNENLVKAVDHFEEAVRLDPNYARVYVGLAYAYRYVTSKGVGSPAESNFKSKQAAEKALALDGNLADAYTALAMIKAGYEWKFAEAEAEYKRALELNPESPASHAAFAFYLVGQQRYDEAVSEIQKAIEIDPNSLSHQVTYGMILYYAHRFDESLAQFGRLLAKDPNLDKAYFWMWLLHDQKGSEARAYEWFMKYQTQIRAAPETLELYRKAYQQGGWKEILREHIRQDEKDREPARAAQLAYEMACFHARLGNHEKALESLQKAFDGRSYSLPLIKTDPFLDPLHGDARFQEIVSRIGLK